MGFPMQEYWSGLPFPSLGNLPDPGIEPGSPALQADCLPTELSGKPHYCIKLEGDVTPMTKGLPIFLKGPLKKLLLMYSLTGG